MPSNWNLEDRIIIDCFPDVIGFDETGDMQTLQKRLILHTDAHCDWERVEYKSLFEYPPSVSVGYEKHASYEVDHDHLSKYLGFSVTAYEADLNETEETHANRQIVNDIGFEYRETIWAQFQVEIDMEDTTWRVVNCRASILGDPQKDLVEVALPPNMEAPVTE